MSYEKEMEVALDAANRAGDYLMNNFGGLVEKTEKGGSHNFSLKQDLDSEKIIVDIIKKGFPKDFILSEESHSQLEDHDRFWIVDPIDGTTNYANGIPYYSVAIALYDSGKVIVGVVYNPPLGQLFHSIRGQGVYVNGKELAMRNPDAGLSSSLIMMGFAYQRGQEMESALANLGKAVNASNGLRRYGSAAFDLCFVASGSIGGFFEAGLKPWDVAAGSLFVQEMGGVVSGYNRPLDIFRMVDGKLSVEIMASKNQKIHSELENILEI